MCVYVLTYGFPCLCAYLSVSLIVFGFPLLISFAQPPHAHTAYLSVSLIVFGFPLLISFAQPPHAHTPPCTGECVTNTDMQGADGGGSISPVPCRRVIRHMLHGAGGCALHAGRPEQPADQADVVCARVCVLGFATV